MDRDDHAGRCHDKTVSAWGGMIRAYTTIDPMEGDPASY